MPKRKSYAGRSSKRAYKRRRGYGTRRKFQSNLGTLIADRTKVAMKYHDDITVNVNGTSGSNYNFRCNSIFDPDASSVGHQPMGHDQIALFYERYVVIGSKITVTFKTPENGDKTNQDEAFVNCGITTIPNTSDQITQNDDFMENNRTTYVQLCPQRPMAKVTKKFSPKRFFGYGKTIDVSNIAAAFGANPANEALWQLRMWNPTTDTSNRTVHMNVAIQYTVVARERKKIIGS